MKPQELTELVCKISLLKGFRAALVRTAVGRVFAQWHRDDLDHTRLEEALETIATESAEACSRMRIGDFVRAEVDLPEGHIYVAVTGEARLIALFDASAQESAMTGRMDDIVEGLTGPVST